jgi:low temperature requirement protein LtrA
MLEEFGPGFVVLAATQESPLREVLWLCAVLVDFGGPAVFGMGGFHVRPGHFVERHGSIVIIALGESVFQMRRAATADLRGADVLMAVVLGVLVSAAMWWAYFGPARCCTDGVNTTRSPPTAWSPRSSGSRSSRWRRPCPR